MTLPSPRSYRVEAEEKRLVLEFSDVDEVRQWFGQIGEIVRMFEWLPDSRSVLADRLLEDPLTWQMLIDGGEVDLTHEEAMRFWVTVSAYLVGRVVAIDDALAPQSVALELSSGLTLFLTTEGHRCPSCGEEHAAPLHFRFLAGMPDEEE